MNNGYNIIAIWPRAQNYLNTGLTVSTEKNSLTINRICYTQDQPTFDASDRDICYRG